MGTIKNLQDLFAKFPTIGRRTAGRFVFYLIHQPKEEIDALITAIQELKNNITLCSFCFQPFESPQGKPFENSATDTLCNVCSDPSRSKELLCVVEKESDLFSIENTKKYKGLYFILGGTLTPRKSNGEHLRIEPLKERVVKNNFAEIIIALNPTPEGISTSILIQRALKELPQFSTLKVTHLAKGLPIGGELEYADDETLESAFDGRK